MLASSVFLLISQLSASAGDEDGPRRGVCILIAMICALIGIIMLFWPCCDRRYLVNIKLSDSSPSRSSIGAGSGPRRSGIGWAMMLTAVSVSTFILPIIYYVMAAAIITTRIACDCVYDRVS